MRAFLDTWVLVERYKGNPDAIKLLNRVEEGLDAHISHVTVAELVNVISREYGERQARIQYAYLSRSPLVMDGTTKESSKNAGLLKTKYRFSLADAYILATAMEVQANLLFAGGDKQYEKEWKYVTEMQVAKLSDYEAVLGL